MFHLLPSRAVRASLGRTLLSTSPPLISERPQSPKLPAEEWDSINFPRPVRHEFPEKVRHGFIPETWFTCLYPKIGYTGPYTLGAGLSLFLVSKELYVLEHNFYNGISMAIGLTYGVKTYGPQVANYLDMEIREIEEQWKEIGEQPKKQIRDIIKQEKKEQWRAEGQKMVFKIKRKLIQIQLEAEYRERLHKAHDEVKERLDLEVERARITTSITQKHMVSWVMREVIKSIDDKILKEYLKLCVSTLLHECSSVRTPAPLPMPTILPLPSVAKIPPIPNWLCEPSELLRPPVVVLARIIYQRKRKNPLNIIIVIPE